jgi:hypothetical protein
MPTSEPVAVECYSGTTYAEEPRAVVTPDNRLEVQAVIDRWRTPDGRWFRVQLSDGAVAVLSYSDAEDQWYLHKDD